MDASKNRETSHLRSIDDVLHELDVLEEGEGGGQGVVLVVQLEFDGTGVKIQGTLGFIINQPQ